MKTKEKNWEKAVKMILKSHRKNQDYKKQLLKSGVDEITANRMAFSYAMHLQFFHFCHPIRKRLMNGQIQFQIFPA